MHKHKDCSRCLQRIVKVQVFRAGCVVCSYVVVLTWIFGQNKLVKLTFPLPWNDLNPGQRPSDMRQGSSKPIQQCKVTAQSLEPLKAGVHLKAVLASLNTAFLLISWSRFQQRPVSLRLLIPITAFWQFC